MRLPTKIGCTLGDFQEFRRIAPNRVIDGYESQIMPECLSHQHPIKRISVMGR
jgi:hypothetical protein